MKTLNSYLSKLGMLCAATIILSTSCKKNSTETPVIPDPVIPVVPIGPDVTFHALASNNTLLTFNGKNVSTATQTTAITGLATGETMLSIDFRPATGQLYGISNQSKLYTINRTTGATLAVGAVLSTAVSGTVASLDFNPTVDRIRLITSTGQNLRLHPETGAVAAVDGAINGVTGASIQGAAYTGNKSGSTATTLFVIDVATDKLYKQDPPNNGTLVEIGALGVDVESAGDFDISSDGTVSIAALKVGGVTGLYNINTTTGAATKVQNNFSATILGIAIPTEPVAYAVNSNNELVYFNPMNPAPVTKAIGGLQAGETVLGIDFRPANGGLYALGSTSRIYNINLGTGAATAVGTSAFTTLLVGTDFGFDFNPTVDRIRIISNTGQNLRANPNDGTIAAVDGAISLAAGTAAITGAAYTNNFAGATTTTLFDIDAITGRLFRQDPPNNGTLVDIGALGVVATSTNGFDIGGTSGVGYALLTVGGVTKVYTINLTSGAATAGATVTGNFRGMAVGLGF
ncbi:DUF4394 domain-containing protein [Mucilaginibacter myungsuensis]|nr:DUF4394 domain-containing protein [Mucilaginibacter myungsuensis]MDN3599015.1 DUF4394 domain-containing protein [Mucilaginibacter myungsuensis]